MSKAKESKILNRFLKKILSGDAQRAGKGSPNAQDAAAAIKKRKQAMEDQLKKIK